MSEKRMTDSNNGWIKSTCAYCGVGCGIEARPTSLGKLEVRGDKDHPSNYGKLCTKGIALGDTVTPLGRLTQPAHIQNEQKQELDWNSATQLVADKFNQTIEEFGADSVAFYVSGQLLTEDYYVANKLMKGFIGSGNIDSNSRLCMASTVVGHKRAFGTDTVPVCYEDLEQADLVVITGSNLAWCHPVLFQRLRAAKQANPALKVIVIDPRYTDTCDIADIHLALESGSDVALFNGLLGYLDDNDKLDSNYIEHHTQGFTEAVRSATHYRYTESGWGDKSVPELTGLTEQQLEQFYKLFASNEKVLTIYSQGVNQSTQGCDKVNAIINCHLATGKIGKPGMGPFSVTGQPNAMGGREVGGLANTLAAHFEFGDPQSHQTVSEFWQTDSLATHAGLKAIDLFDAMNEGKIKAVWIMATNPVVSLPDSEKIKAALEKCPFVVVSDCIADTETTRLADVVLPAQGWSEKSGTVTNSERRISRQRRILPSPGEAKPDWWILKEVAQKMGFKEQFDYRHEGEIFKEYCEMTALGNETGKARDLCLIGLTQLDEKGYGELTPQQWPVLEYQPEIIEQRMFTNGEFFTESGKAQFIAVEHDKPIADTSLEFPLIMNTGRIRDQWHTMSRTGLAAGLGEHTPEPFVAMHPDTVAELGLDEFGLDAFNHATINPVVKVRSAQGECQARLVVTKEMRKEQVFMPIHWNGTTAKNSKPCDLILPNTDSNSGQPEFKHTPVMIEPCDYRSEAVLVSDSVVDCDEFDYWVRQRVEGGFLYRISSVKNPMELVIQLSNTIESQPLKTSENVKSLHYHGNKHYKNHGSATLDEFGLKQAFVVNTQLEQSSIDWLVDCFSKPIDEEFEAEFLSALAN
ncbi:nitrate reductase [Vibrio lentus]|uniref:molybdopterin oxidoreductase family protein n=1 Tax=Vibrio lentus TaxID=136468 RepID=UPI000C81F8B1|nr:nitrate reductase [Vibrio lentus]MCC4815653.1 nitrate reductase [Vibrio lentus]PMG68247.1 nitrate reductase [Vibrio lentus]PMK90126.1 nitrate reductase [Vibrio lentus]PML25035.1 nitrate reductase [Vibrio lentus]PMM27413.1 nitrate reductase [Vibrio lentus]